MFALGAFARRLCDSGALRHPPSGVSPDLAGRRLQWECLDMFRLCDFVVKPVVQHLVQVCSGAVQPCSWMELVASGPQAPKYFVSHSWEAPFRDLLSAIAHLAVSRGLEDTSIIWLCALAHNHFRPDGGEGDLLGAPISEAVRRCREAVVVLDPAARCLHRAWSLFDLAVVAEEEKPLILCTARGPLGAGSASWLPVLEVINKVDPDALEAGSSVDCRRIFNYIAHMYREDVALRYAGKDLLTLEPLPPTAACASSPSRPAPPIWPCATLAHLRVLLATMLGPPPAGGSGELGWAARLRALMEGHGESKAPSSSNGAALARSIRFHVAAPSHLALMDVLTAIELHAEARSLPDGTAYRLHAVNDSDSGLAELTLEEGEGYLVILGRDVDPVEHEALFVSLAGELRNATLEARFCDLAAGTGVLAVNEPFPGWRWECGHAGGAAAGLLLDACLQDEAVWTHLGPRLLAPALHEAAFLDSADAAAKLAKFTARAQELERLGHPLEVGAMRSGHGETALHVAAASGSPAAERALSSLLELGLAINAQDASGDTPLHWAAFNGRAGSLRVLLGHRADPTLCNRASRTPLDVGLVRPAAFLEPQGWHCEVESAFASTPRGDIGAHVSPATPAAVAAAGGHSKRGRPTPLGSRIISWEFESSPATSPSAAPPGKRLSLEDKPAESKAAAGPTSPVGAAGAPAREKRRSRARSVVEAGALNMSGTLSSASVGREADLTHEFQITLSKKPGIKVGFRRTGELLLAEPCESNLLGLWNKDHPNEQVLPCDRVVEVNDVWESAGCMLAELKGSQQLLITLLREARPPEEPASSTSRERTPSSLALDLALRGAALVGLADRFHVGASFASASASPTSASPTAATAAGATPGAPAGGLWACCSRPDVSSLEQRLGGGDGRPYGPPAPVPLAPGWLHEGEAGGSPYETSGGVWP